MAMTWTNESILLHEWAEKRFENVDLVASWPMLNSIYKHLEFLDEITDEQRIHEYKLCTKEANRALTRYRNAVMGCYTIDKAIEYLGSQFKAGRQSDVKDRVDVAYQSLKQQLLRSCIQELATMKEQLATLEAEEEVEDEW